MKYVVLILATLFAPAAQAQQVIGGLGFDEDGGGIHVVAEYRGEPFFARQRFQAALGVAARVDIDGDAWVGIGFGTETRFADRVFLETSFMPGFYAENDDRLGGSLQFRSLIGIGYDLSDTSAVSIAIDHLSNGGIEDFNPGSEAIALRYRYRF